MSCELRLSIVLNRNKTRSKYAMKCAGSWIISCIWQSAGFYGGLVAIEIEITETAAVHKNKIMVQYL